MHSLARQNINLFLNETQSQNNVSINIVLIPNWSYGKE